MTLTERITSYLMMNSRTHLLAISEDLNADPQDVAEIIQLMPSVTLGEHTQTVTYKHSNDPHDDVTGAPI